MSINMHVFPSESWYSARLGLDFSESTFKDPIKRTEIMREAERELYKIFGDVQMGDHDPKPNPIASNSYGHRFMSALFGAGIYYQSNQAPSAIHLDADYDKMKQLQIPDLEKSEVIRLFFEQADILTKKYGYCKAEINFGSPLNVAVNLYGKDFLLACIDEPETAQHVLKVIADTQYLLYEKLQTVVEPDVYPKSPIDMGYGNCQAIMLSPALYREVVLPVDKYFRSRANKFFLHHCGVFDKFVDIYKELNPNHLDIGGGTNYKEVCPQFPTQSLSLIVNTMDVESKTPAEIQSLVKSIIDSTGAPERISYMWCTDISKDMSDDKVRALKTSTEKI